MGTVEEVMDAGTLGRSAVRSVGKVLAPRVGWQVDR